MSHSLMNKCLASVKQQSLLINTFSYWILSCSLSKNSLTVTQTPHILSVPHKQIDNDKSDRTSTGLGVIMFTCFPKSNLAMLLF